MYTLSDKAHFQALTILQGKHKLAAEQWEIMNWITKQFGVTALDFYCEKRETSKGLPQQLVHVILNTVEDVKKMQTHRAESAQIAGQFLKYFKSAAVPDPLRSEAFPADTNPFPEIIVTYRPLKVPDDKIIQEMLKDEHRAILKTFESVWTISMGVVFYYTEEQKKENLANGLSEKINQLLLQANEKYGFDGGLPYSFGRELSYRFDSKEVFDRDYQGKWHDYWM